MIPQNFKDILGNVENAAMLQTMALIIFMIFFGVLVYRVFSKPKKYYSDEERAPLEDDDSFKF